MFLPSHACQLLVLKVSKAVKFVGELAVLDVLDMCASVFKNGKLDVVYLHYMLLTLLLCCIYIRGQCLKICKCPIFNLEQYFSASQTRMIFN